MDGTSGVGPAKPGEAPEIGAPQEGPSGGGDVLHTKLRTLDDLKNLLISQYGEQKGKKFYKMFIQSFAMMMLQQVQSTAEHAKQAEREARQEAQH
jgi:hypothetical protein